jgi:hypothetical protein
MVKLLLMATQVQIIQELICKEIVLTHQAVELQILVMLIQWNSNTTTFKTLLQRGGSASDRTAAWVNLWRSTSAITSLSIATFGGNFATNSTFSLYGIASA